MSFSRRVAFALALLLIVTTLPAAAQGLSPRSPASPVLPMSPQEAPEGSCPPSAILFTQSDSQTIEDFLGISCAQQPPSPQYHRRNSWWRVFRPEEEFGVLGPVQVCEIQFGVESSVTPGATGQPITFNVGVSLDQPFPDGFRYQIGSVSTTLPDLTKQIFTLPVNLQLPAGAAVYIEAQVADGLDAQYILFPGANSQPEGSPSYLSSPDCGIENPVTLAEIGFPDSHFVFNFRGVEIPIAPTSLAFDSDPNFVVDIGDTTTMQTAWTNFFAGPQSITSTFESIHASGALTKGLPDTTANYGLMPVGTPTSCVSTGDCPVLTAGGTKILGADEDLFVAETLLLPPIAPQQGAFPDKIWEVHVGGSFGDVPTGNIFYAFIENIFHNSVTGGCGNGNYCPANATLRKQMAVFLLKAFEGAGYLPPPATGVFNDVPAADPFAPWIEELAARGITSGCNPDLYCPDNPVLRKQMAVFLLKTKLGAGYTPPAPTGIFDDVPADGFRPFIEDLYNRGITGGCSGGPPPAPISYCPDNSVTRGQMAPFLVKTFVLLLYGP